MTDKSDDERGDYCPSDPNGPGRTGGETAAGLKRKREMEALASAPVPRTDKSDGEKLTLQRRIAAWVNSPEGQSALDETAEHVRKSMEEFRRASIISRESMSRPVDRIVWD